MKRYLQLLLLFLTLSGCAQKFTHELEYLSSFPADGPVSKPVIFLLHGYGSDENDLFALRKSFGEDYAVFSLKAPVAAGNGNCWFRMEFLKGGGFRFDTSDVTEASNKIVSFIRTSARYFKTDTTRVIILGFSQGAMMAFKIALHSSFRPHAVVALSGRLPKDTVGIKYDQSKTAFFIGHGLQDNVIAAQEAEKAREFLLRLHPRNVETKIYGIAHGISPEELSDIRLWLVKKAGW